MSSAATGRWLYERGAHRRKHCWNRDEASFCPSPKGPVGKCPNSIRDAEAQALLDNGIPFYEDEEDKHPSHIYSVREGVIYEAAPTQAGLSYHGYPWRGDQHRGDIPERIFEELMKRADEGGHIKEFKRWVETYASRKMSQSVKRYLNMS